jgi:hypothetical protein
MRAAQFAPNFVRRDRRWILLRRAYHEGWRTAFKRYALWSKILTTRPFPVEPIGSGAPVEVHLLCHEFDYLSAIWALKSFYHFADAKFPLMIHTQGYMPSRAIARLQHHFPGAHLITQIEADAIVEERLDRLGLHRLIARRRASPIMLKLTDFMLLGDASRVLFLDSDVLFFATPALLMIAAESGRPPTLFMRDCSSGYLLSAERALEIMGFDLRPCINSGLAVVERQSIDLSRCDEYLRHEELMLKSGLIEQTLYALAASEHGAVAYLPTSYLVSLRPGIGFEGIIARHYAGPSRHLLMSEGMPRLIKTGWLQQIHNT